MLGSFCGRYMCRALICRWLDLELLGELGLYFLPMGHPLAIIFVFFLGNEIV